MSESKSLFAAVIEEHLALKRRNAHLNGQRPLSEYEVADPFDNHALFKSEAEARREEEETGDYPALDTSEFEPAIVGPVRRGLARSTAVPGLRLGRLSSLRVLARPALLA